MVVESLIAYALRIRELRRAGPSNLEQALAPAFQRLLESLLPHISANELVVTPSSPRRAWEDPTSLFQSLPVWAISNFSSLRVFQRDDPIASIEIVPEAALDPETTDAKAERLIRNGDLAGLIRALTPLALADPPPADNAKELAANLAHAARLVRSIVEDRLVELTEAGETNAPLQDVRHTFREVLYAHPQAAGYDARRFDPLFAAAFAQTPQRAHQDDCRRGDRRGCRRRNRRS
jgi:hypothetical protein